jgi:hypothetical protein
VISGLLNGIVIRLYLSSSGKPLPQSNQPLNLGDKLLGLVPAVDGRKTLCPSI